MNWDIDDPRWTAWLLGDLDDAERHEAEAHLAADPDLKRQVEGLRETLEVLKQAFESEPPSRELEPLRSEAVRRAESAPGGKTALRLWLPTAAAALLALGFGLAHLLNRPGASSQSETPMPELEMERSIEFDDAPSMDSLKEPQPAAMPEEPEQRMKQSLEINGGVVLDQRADAPTDDAAPGESRSRPRRSAFGYGNDVERAEAEEEAKDSASEGAWFQKEEIPMPTPTPTPTATPTPTPTVEP